jgi:hypothetical protein
MKITTKALCLSVLYITTTLAQTTPWRANPEYYIEPLSPILGSDNLRQILESKETPSAIFEKLSDNKTIQEIKKRSTAYSNIVLEGLSGYCEQDKIETRKYDIHKKIHFAVVPVDPILLEFEQKYFKSLAELKKVDTVKLDELNRTASTSVLEKRKNCGAVAKRINDTKEMISSICKPLGEGFAKKCSNFTNINLELFSPESSYPRTQFSINGFTRDFNLKVNQISGLKLQLETLYLSIDAYRDSIKKTNQPLAKRHWETLKLYTNNSFEMIFLLSGLTRNLPSLDYLYGLDAKKGLMVEVYFWKIRQLMDEIDDIDKMAIYPKFNYDKPEKVGLYHFYTAAYQTCSLLKAGYSSDLAVAGALAQKIAYKSDKFIGAMKNKSFTEQLKELPKTLKEQGTLEAIKGGLDAAFWAEELCFPKDKNKLWEHAQPLWLALVAFNGVLSLML